jgi:hypothetical protein
MGREGRIGRAVRTGRRDRPAGDLLSAREAFSLAQKAAAEWSPDAVLVEINTFPRPPQPDGPADLQLGQMMGEPIIRPKYIKKGLS